MPTKGRFACGLKPAMNVTSSTPELPLADDELPLSELLEQATEIASTSPIRPAAANSRGLLCILISYSVLRTESCQKSTRRSTIEIKTLIATPVIISTPTDANTVGVSSLPLARKMVTPSPLSPVKYSATTAPVSASG